VTLDDELGRAGVGRPGRPDGPFPGRICREVTDFSIVRRNLEPLHRRIVYSMS
jgi:hypothetical protein